MSKSEKGRPTKYKNENETLVRKLCLLGATDAQIADFFDVSESTINHWKEQHPDFRQALRAGKLLADAEIAEALYHRAKGYSHPEEKIMQYEGAPIRVETTKHYPPDTAAAYIWLKNRNPQTWKDKPESPQSHDVDISEDYVILTADEALPNNPIL